MVTHIDADTMTCLTHGRLSVSSVYVNRSYVYCAICVGESKRNGYAKDPEAAKTRASRYRILLKVEVLSHYSGGEPSCFECQQKDLRCLGLDHINSDGCEHRRRDSSGQAVYRWAKQFGFPSTLQVLCHNCNWRRRPLQTVVSIRHSFARKARIEVLSHYSDGVPKCAECDEFDLRVLTIDHINGGGASHTRYLGTPTVYAFLKRNGFPSGYQVLCQNHNLGKHCLGWDDYRRAV